MNRKHLTTILAGIGLATIPSAAFAGVGDATALHVEGVITVSDCHAEDGASDCTALSLLGSDVTGTSQEGEGSTTDSLGGGEDPSGNGAGSLWLFRSTSTVDGNGNSESSSSAVSLDLGGQIQVEVLRAQANSNGDAESDGAYINIGGEEIHVLHAGSTGGEGEAAVAYIAGQGILTSEQTGGVFCPLPAAPIAEADVVCASGSKGSVVGNIDALTGIVTGQIVTAEGGGAPAPAPNPTPVTPTTPTTDNETPIGPAPDFPLARTGLDIFALLAGGIFAIGAGEAVRRRGSAVTFA